MDKLFSEIETLLRYVLSGLVGLVVAWAIDHDHSVLRDIHATVSSWWIVVLLVPIVGVTVYTLHNLLSTPTLLGMVFWIVLWIDERARPRFKVMVGKRREVTEQNWLRRGADDTRHRAVQREFDKWSAMVQFLYCSGWVTLAAPVTLSFFHQDHVVKEPILAGLVLLLAAVIGDGFKTKHSLWMQERWKIEVPNA